MEYVVCSANNAEIIRRRTALASAYSTLPEYGSAAFWQIIEGPFASQPVPNEVLVRCLRTAAASGDDAGRNRLIEIIVRRTQAANEAWAGSVLKYLNVRADERRALVADLYADLCECLLRALLDPQRTFWEENFQHCLRFERQHAYRGFMLREGRWSSQPVNGGASADSASESIPRRVPRRLIQSLSRLGAYKDDEVWEQDIEDEQAQHDLQAVEQDELLRLVLRLPQKLKAVVLLIFWEGRSEKDTAEIVGVSDRTVRNRLREAAKILRIELEAERELVYG